MIKAIYDDMQELKEKVDVLEEDVSALKENVTGIQLTLENETNRNIRVIAEGHLDLCRKLKERISNIA